IHGRASGVAAPQVADEEEARRAAAAVLAYLPAHADEPPPRWSSADPADRPTPELRAMIPPAATGSYDVRGVIAAIIDDGAVLELWSGWAPNLVTALTTIDGQPVGVVANQPRSLAGTL